MKKNGGRILAILLTVLMLAGSVPEAFVFAEDATVDEILAHMTLRDKICQCLMMDFRKWEDAEGKARDVTVLPAEVAEEIANYKFGSVILFDNNIKNTQDTLRLTKDMQAAAINGGGLPLMIATDQEGGLVARFGSGTFLPGNMAVAASGDAENAKLSGQIIGQEMSVLGINTTLAPVLDVNSNAGNPIVGIRSFGDGADEVGAYGTAFLNGLNGTGTIGCVKHFPGHGDTATDSHMNLPVVNRTKEQLYECDLKPFKAAADSGADMVMTAHILYPEVDSSKLHSEKTNTDESRPATMSTTILTGILRGEMSYDGIIITDALNMHGIDDFFPRGQAAFESFMAGADMICMPIERTEGDGYITNKEEFESRLNEFLTYIETKAQGDSAVEARINEAAGRVIALKMKKGILDYDADDYTDERAAATVGNEEHRRIEREMSAEGVTVVRNDNGLLPYKPAGNERILMLCPLSNQKAQMVMGLNRARAAGLVPKSVTVDVYNFSGEITGITGELKDKIDKADLVIITSQVADNEDMSFGYYTSLVPKMVTEYCRNAGKKSVVMSDLLPYDVQLYPDADAVIVAYGRVGSSMEVTQELIDGQITADPNGCGPNIIAGIEVAFGVYGASGHLPVNVPGFNRQTASYTDEILYARGYGITYDALKPSHDEPPAQTDSNINYLPLSYKAKIRYVSRGRRRITVRMKKKPSKKSGVKYQIAYRPKGSKTWRYRYSSKKYLTIKKLKKGKRYYVKARACKSSGNTVYLGKWSTTKLSGRVR